MKKDQFCVKISIHVKMAQLESFSVWIYDKKKSKISCPYQDRLNYIFSWKRPCNLPKSNVIHLVVTVADQHLTNLEARYFYGPSQCEVIVVKYSAEELATVETRIVGEGSFVERIVARINQLTPRQKQELIDRSQFPCFGSALNTLLHIFIFQLAILLIVLAWLSSSCFWKNKLLPLYVKLPPVEGFVSRKLLKLVAIYFIYLFSMDLCIKLRPLLEVILSLIEVWDESFVDGEDLDSDFFQAQVNLGFLKYVIWQFEDKKCRCAIKEECKSFVTGNSVDPTTCTKDPCFVTGTSVDPSTCFATGTSVDTKGSCFATGTSVDTKGSCFATGTSVDTKDTCFVTGNSVDTKDTCFVTGSSVDTKGTYLLLESKKKEVEKCASQVNRSLASHFSVLSEEVVSYAMIEVRRRLEGCVEECIYRSYPRIETYIQSALQEKSDYFFLLKEQLEIEVSRVRDVCQQAFLVLEAVPQYEERIRHLENEVKAIRAEKNGDTDLHRKVEHLQSTVTQLLRAVRCRV